MSVKQNISFFSLRKLLIFSLSLGVIFLMYFLQNKQQNANVNEDPNNIDTNNNPNTHTKGINM